MERLNIYMKLSDRRYQKRLAEFFTKNYPQMNVRVIENKEGEAGEHKRGLLLLDSMVSEEEKRQLCLGYGRPVFLDPKEGINPYQSGHVIARKLITIGKGSDDVTVPAKKPLPEEQSTVEKIRSSASFKEEKGILLTVYSPSGGSGTSTLSRALAKALVKEGGARVLLISLETASDWKRYHLAQETDEKVPYALSELLYSYVAEPLELQSERLKQMVKTQPDGYDFLPPTKDFEDLFCLSEEETEEFIDRLLQEYTYVVVDPGKQWTRVQRQFYLRSRKLILLVQLTPSGRAKLASIEKQLSRGMAQRILVLRDGQTHGKANKAAGKRGEEALTQLSAAALSEERELYEYHGTVERIREETEYYRTTRELVRTWILSEKEGQGEEHEKGRG